MALNKDGPITFNDDFHHIIILYNLHGMSVAQQNHGTHDQSPLYNGDSSRDDNSRNSRARVRNVNRGGGRGRGGRGRGAPNPFTANHQRQLLNY